MYAGRVFDAEVIAGGGAGTATSPAIRMDEAEAMSIHTQVATTAGTINVTYTYQVSSNSDGPWVDGNISIAAHTPALDITGFSPEASKWIRIIATNNDASAVTLTSVLNMQEG
jgi:hypothetical protein